MLIKVLILCVVIFSLGFGLGYLACTAKQARRRYAFVRQFNFDLKGDDKKRGKAARKNTA